MSTKHFCDDCGIQLIGSWSTGERWGQRDWDLCHQCYYRRERLEKAGQAHPEKRTDPLRLPTR